MSKTVCLNMIVKDERDVIQRCLFSVKQLIDYWVIVDTGSTDDTKELIRKSLQGIPGELHERPWVHFAHNRNEALSLARNKADYILFMDADEWLEIFESFDKEQLTEDFYLFRIVERSQTDMYRVSLVRDHPAWFWQGMYHEAITASETMAGRRLDAVLKYGMTKDGNQSKNPRKFLQEAEWIEQALAQDPENSRYVFYLAQSYGNAKHYEKALALYEKRAAMGDSEEEVFWSYYCIGMIAQHLELEPERWIQAYSKAYELEPSRAEPLFQLAQYFYQINQPLLGYIIAESGLSLEKPTCCGYFHPWVYDYALLLFFGKCAKAIGRKDEALSVYNTLKSRNLPEEIGKELL